MDLDDKIYGSKKYSDLIKEIHTNSRNTKGTIKSLIDQLSELINEPGDATLLVPYIKEYLSISVKNDELLIKLANNLEKVLSGKGKSGGEDVPSDLKALLDEEEELNRSVEDKDNTDSDGEFT